MKQGSDVAGPVRKGGFAKTGHFSAVRALVICLLLAQAAAAADDPGTVTGDRGSDMVVDLLVVRPLGIVGTAVGAVLFVVSLPFTLPTGSAGETAQTLVAEPAEYTFNRPLGDFWHCGADRHPCGNP